MYPDGGHGGAGGSVILVADSKLSSLRMRIKHYTAPTGNAGTSKKQRGRCGRNLIVRVPCGVMVKRVLKMDEEWDETTKQVAGYTPEIDLGYLTKGGSTFMSDDKEAAAAAAVRAEQQQEDDAEFDEDLNVYSEKDLEAMGDVEYFEGEEGIPDDILAMLNSDHGYFEDEIDEEQEVSTQETIGEEEQDNSQEDNGLEVDQMPTKLVPVADLDTHGSFCVVAKGGRGGIGTVAYARLQLQDRPSAVQMMKDSSPEYGEGNVQKQPRLEKWNMGPLAHTSHFVLFHLVLIHQWLILNWN